MTSRPEPRPQQAGRPWPAARPSRWCNFDDERGEALDRAAPRPPRARRMSGGGGRPCIRCWAALRAAADLDVEAASRSGVTLVLSSNLQKYCEANAVVTSTAPPPRRDTPSAPTPKCGSRRAPSAGNVGNLAGRTAPRAVRPGAAYLSLAGRCLGKGCSLQVCRRGGPHRVVS